MKKKQINGKKHFLRRESFHHISIREMLNSPHRSQVRARGVGGAGGNRYSDAQYLREDGRARIQQSIGKHGTSIERNENKMWYRMSEFTEDLRGYFTIEQTEKVASTRKDTTSAWPSGKTDWSCSWRKYAKPRSTARLKVRMRSVQNGAPIKWSEDDKPPSK